MESEGSNAVLSAQELDKDNVSMFPGFKDADAFVKVRCVSKHFFGVSVSRGASVYASSPCAEQRAPADGMYSQPVCRWSAWRLGFYYDNRLKKTEKLP